MRSLAGVVLLSGVFLTDIGTAQGVLPLTGTYRVTGMTGHFLCAGTASTTPGVRAITSGTAQFMANGSWSWSLSGRDMCRGGPGTAFTNPGSGTYEYGPSGEVFIFNPTAPDYEAHVRADGAVILGGPSTTYEPSTSLLAIKTSAGWTNSALSGVYHVIRLVQDHRATGLIALVEYGERTFDGVNAWSESGERWTIPGSGPLQAYSQPYGPPAATYLVQADGTLSIDGGQNNGVVSASGEIASWVISSGTITTWTIALRGGSRRLASDLGGQWGLCSRGLAVDPGPGIDFFYTNYGDFGMRALSPTSGDFMISAISIDNQFGAPPSANWTGDVGSFDMDLDPAHAAGRFVLSVGATGQTFPGAVSAAGNFLAVAIFGTDDVEMMVMERKVYWPVPYGRATPGTGGVAPTLQNSGGFPILGNAGFGLEVTSARPNALALLAMSLAQSLTGLPTAGGTLWVDPAAMISVLRVTSNTGTALFPVPIPATPSLSGVVLYAQVLAVDSGAPAGVAMSRGLRIELGH